MRLLRILKDEKAEVILEKKEKELPVADQPVKASRDEEFENALASKFEQLLSNEFVPTHKD